MAAKIFVYRLYSAVRRSIDAKTVHRRSKPVKLKPRSRFYSNLVIARALTFNYPNP